MMARAVLAVDELELKIGEYEAQESKTGGPIGTVSATGSDLKPVLKEIEEAGLKLGWSADVFTVLRSGSRTDTSFNILYKVLGLILSGFLISFGALFWHDLLSAVMGVRKVLQNKGSTQ